MAAANNLDFFNSPIYRKAMTDSGDLIAVMDQDYCYLFASRALMQFLGLKRSNITGRTAPEVLGEELFSQEIKPYIDKSFLGRRTSFELSIKNPRLGDRYFHLICYPVFEGGLRAVVVVARDITGLRRREQKLKWYQQVYQVVMEKASDILLLMDPEGIIVSCSRYVDRQTGLSSHSVIGQSVRHLLTPESYEVVEKHLAEWKTRHVRHQSWEAEVVVRGGGKVPFEVNSTPVYEHGTLKWVVVVARDISRRKYLEDELKNSRKELERQMEEQYRQAEERLRRTGEEFHSLSSKILEDQERERNAIGRELHDELGSYLTILGIYLGKLTKEVNKSAWLDQFTQTMDDMIHYVRSLSHALYPAMLEWGDLLAALVNYFGNYERRTGIKVRFAQRGFQGRLPLNIEVVAYRIIQEALTNAAKHSGANEVRVDIARERDALRIYIEDNGRGFDISGVTKESYGISGMKNRALFVGGKLTVDSAPGRGTVIECSLPVTTGQETRPPSIPLEG